MIFLDGLSATSKETGFPKREYLMDKRMKGEPSKSTFTEAFLFA